MSTSSRKDRRKLRAAQRANTPYPAQAQPDTSPSAVDAQPSDSTIQLDALLEQFAALSEMNPADLLALEAAAGPEFAEFATRLETSDHPDSIPTSGPEQTPANLFAALSRHAGGPISDAGKARSAQNSFKHGLAGSFSHFKLLPGENSAEYAELLSEVRAQFVPRTTAERHKIDDMAQAWWLQHRARNLQTSAIESGDDKALALYLRYETTQRRSYQMAYKDFQDMQKHRLASIASPDLTSVAEPGTFQSQREYPAPPEPQPAIETTSPRPLAA